MSPPRTMSTQVLVGSRLIQLLLAHTAAPEWEDLKAWEHPALRSEQHSPLSSLRAQAEAGGRVAGGGLRRAAPGRASQRSAGRRARGRGQGLPCRYCSAARAMGATRGRCWRALCRRLPASGTGSPGGCWGGRCVAAVRPRASRRLCARGRSWRGGGIPLPLSPFSVRETLMAEPSSAASGGRRSLPGPRPPPRHCQRQPAALGTCRGCCCPCRARRSAGAAAGPARWPRIRCRQQQGPGGRRCCLCLPGPAAASGNEYDSARPRLLLHAQLLRKCCFFLPPLPLLHASGAARQLLSVLRRLHQTRPVLEAALRADPPALGPPGLAVISCTGGSLLLPPVPPLLPVSAAGAQGHSSARHRRPSRRKAR